MLVRRPLPVHDNNFDNSQYGKKQLHNTTTSSQINGNNSQSAIYTTTTNNNKNTVELQSFSPSAPSADLLDLTDNNTSNTYMSQKQPLINHNNQLQSEPQLRQRKIANEINIADVKKPYLSNNQYNSESIYPSLSLEPSAPSLEEYSLTSPVSTSSSSNYNQINPNPHDNAIVLRPSQVLSLIPNVGVKHLLNEQFYANEKYPTVCFIRHIVTNTSDLTDLAVKYSCTVSDIRRHNRRVVFDYLDNLLGEYIHIPVKKDLNIGLTEQEPLDEKQTLDLAERANINRQHQAVQSFLTIVEKRYYENKGLSHEVVSTEEAQFYLEDHNWDVSAAVAQYFDDIAWEQKKLGKNPKITFTEKKINKSTVNTNNKHYNNNTEYSTSNTKQNVQSNFLQAKPRASPASAILSMAAARQAKLTSLVQHEESRLKSEKQAELMKKNAAKQQSTNDTNNTNTNTNTNTQGNWYTYNGHKYSKLADPEGFFALPSNMNENPATQGDYVALPHPTNMQEMTVMNSNNNNNNTNNKNTNNSSSSSNIMCWPNNSNRNTGSISSKWQYLVHLLCNNWTKFFL